MSVESAVEASFRKLLKEYPYGKITVSMICEDSGIARKTFYSHFDNKEDIIAKIFKRDVIDPQSNMRELLPHAVKNENVSMFLTKLYQSILDDKDFYYALVGPLRGVDDTFIRVATNSIYTLAHDVGHLGHYSSSEEEADYAAYFFASSQAMLVQKWISEGMTVAPEVLSSWYQKLTMGYWRDFLNL